MDLYLNETTILVMTMIKVPFDVAALAGVKRAGPVGKNQNIMQYNANFLRLPFDTGGDAFTGAGCGAPKRAVGGVMGSVGGGT